MAQFYIVDFNEPGVIAKGKGSRNIVVRLTRVLSKLNVAAEVLPYDALVARGATSDRDSYVLLHYNELFVVQNHKVDWLRSRERELADLGYKVLHSVEHGRVIGHKVRQNRALTAAGVPMPRLVEDGVAFDTAFSNEVSNAHVPIQIVDSTAELDPGRYNTEYIDCRHEHNGQVWHVCIRAQAVGEQVLFSWVRAGPQPNVRTRGTPVDAQLLKHFHAKLVEPNADQIRDIARGVKRAFGVGFFAHDILPCAKTGRLFLCETNYKFYEGFYRFYMKSIANELPTPAFFDGRKVTRRMAKALVNELQIST